MNNQQHALEIMRAALPYLNTPVKDTIELTVKAGELMEALSETGKNQLSACDLNPEPVNMEALLLHIEEVCTDREKEMVTMLLNFIKARRLYQTYQMFRASSGAGDNPGANGGFMGGSSSILEFLKSQIPEEQRGIFENLNTILNAIPS